MCRWNKPFHREKDRRLYLLMLHGDENPRFREWEIYIKHAHTPFVCLGLTAPLHVICTINWPEHWWAGSHWPHVAMATTSGRAEPVYGPLVWIRRRSTQASRVLSHTDRVRGLGQMASTQRLFKPGKTYLSSQESFTSFRKNAFVLPFFSDLKRVLVLLICCPYVPFTNTRIHTDTRTHGSHWYPIWRLKWLI